MSLRKFSFAVAAAFVCANAATATVIELSAVSSDETDAGVLDATLEFGVVGNTLTLTVTNTTVNPFEYNINEIYFNGNDVVDLVLDPIAGWDLQTGVAAGYILMSTKAAPDTTARSPDGIPRPPPSNVSTE